METSNFIEYLSAKLKLAHFMIWWVEKKSELKLVSCWFGNQIGCNICIAGSKLLSEEILWNFLWYDDKLTGKKFYQLLTLIYVRFVYEADRARRFGLLQTFDKYELKVACGRAFSIYFL